MRYIVVIRKPGQPQAYYLSRNGLRCYTAKNVAVLRTLRDAEEQRDHFSKLMPEFRLSVEVLPAHVRNVSTALLSARPVEEELAMASAFGGQFGDGPGAAYFGNDD